MAMNLPFFAFDCKRKTWKYYFIMSPNQNTGHISVRCYIHLAKGHNQNINSQVLEVS